MIANTGSVPVTMRLAITALERARMEPTDKSIPPVKMTKVIPKAMIALMDTWRNKLRKLEKETVVHDRDNDK